MTLLGHFRRLVYLSTISLDLTALSCNLSVRTKLAKKDIPALMRLPRPVFLCHFARKSFCHDESFEKQTNTQTHSRLSSVLEDTRTRIPSLMHRHTDGTDSITSPLMQEIINLILVYHNSFVI